MLRFLAENPNRLVTKDELIQAVWPGIAVTDDSIVQCIHEIRRAFHDEEQSVVKTVPKRGYRLVLPAVVRPVSQQPVWHWAALIGILVLLVCAASARWWVQDAGTGKSPVDRTPVVAVLPFIAQQDATARFPRTPPRMSTKCVHTWGDDKNISSLYDTLDESGRHHTKNTVQEIGRWNFYSCYLKRRT